MRTMIYYKVKPSVAIRAGVSTARYRTEDGCMILNEQDVRMIRLEPEEYLRGVAEAVLTEPEALLLIEQGGRRMGLPPEDMTEVIDETSEENVVIESNNEKPVTEEETIYE